MDVYVNVVFLLYPYHHRACEGATSKARFFFSSQSLFVGWLIGSAAPSRLILLSPDYYVPVDLADTLG